MESGLRELLDKIYELEGLVHLALKRDVSSDDFLRLIARKGMEISELCKVKREEANEEKSIQLNQTEYQITEEEHQHLSPSLEPFILEEYSIDEEISESDDNSLEVVEPADNQESEKNNNPEEQRGKLVFSINDRFRFRKELFDNSDIDFNNTLALVASMENYEEAEDYFINEEGFDKNNPVVIEFFDVLKRYFK